VENLTTWSFGESGLETIEIRPGNRFYPMKRAIVRYSGQASEIGIPDTVIVLDQNGFFKCESIRHFFFGAFS
jgi:hypothetical protein